jgi:putative tricarboxylic transport membrane protein
MKFSKDTLFGALGVALAAVYWMGADDIQRSFLADEVGADGVPKMLAVALGVLGAVTMLRGRKAAIAADVEDDNGRPHLRALGLLTIGVLYAALLSPLGYFLATAALIAGVTAYAGQNPDWRLAVAAIGGSVVLWLIFDRIFGVALPRGFWPQLLG